MGRTQVQNTRHVNCDVIKLVKETHIKDVTNLHHFLETKTLVLTKQVTPQ